MKQTVVLRGMWGLGDNIYSRPFVRLAAARFNLYLETPWPELFADLPLCFVAPPDRELYTQMRNVRRQAPTTWSRPPAGAVEMRFAYGGEIERGSIIASLERQMPLDGAPLKMDLPALPASPVQSDKPIALIRPATVRQEWRNEARNPKPEYLAALTDRLRADHEIVVVGSVLDGKEWFDGVPPKGDVELLSGELGLGELLALFCAADIVIGGVGWIVPAALATRQKTFVVLGGHGAYNAPEKITDPRLDLKNLGFAVPSRFCRCTTMLHNCDKTIPDLVPQFEAFRGRLGLCSSASLANGCPGFQRSASAITR